MPKRLAIQFSDHVIRVLAAGVDASGKVQFEQALSIDLPESDDAVETLAEAVEANRWKGCDASLLMKRGEVEIRQLQLPPVPDDELPEMVRLQAVRGFAASGDRSIVDFVRSSDRQDGINVLATSADGKAVAAACGRTAAAGLQVDRVALQSLSVASLYPVICRDHADVDLKDVTMVAMIDGQAEIVVIRDSALASVRTVRLAAASTVAANDSAAMLADEIRRSRLSCGCTANCPIIFIGRDDHAMATSLESHGNQVFAVDPLTLHQSTTPPTVSGVGGSTDGGSIDNGPPESFAALCGLLHCESPGGDRWNVNFLQPRKKVEPKPNRVLQTLAAVLAAVLLVATGVAVYQTLASRDAKVAAVEQQIDAIADDVADAELAMSEVAKVEQFLDADLNWVTELHRLASAVPPADELIFSEIRGAADLRSGGGSIELKGRVTEPKVLSELASSVTGEHRRVIGDGASETDSEDDYDWSFSQKLVIAPEAVVAERLDVSTPTADLDSDSDSDSDADSDLGSELQSDSETEPTP